ncbi:endonuclease [Lewinellaceae bacterium SD302]|nr:endonuclease [Lewinellaceae bacterium SD302]
MNKLFVLCFLLSLGTLSAQETQYKVGAIGFYNVENLFDTIDQPNVRDTEFTPAGDYAYNSTVYYHKLANLAKVMSEMATDVTPDGLSMIGVAEIENRSVLEDLVAQPALKDRNYQIAHYDSWDKRGIDVGLLYQEKYFDLDTARYLRMHDLFYADGDTVFTRDILWVSGLYDGEPIHVFVNHWPSRRGGEAASAPLRNAAALRFKLVADSIQLADPTAKIVMMGDLNDDPTSPSLDKVIAAKSKVNKLKSGDYYNPMYELFRQGLGSNAYRDKWSLFDQIVLNEKLARDESGWRYYQTHIYNPAYMYQKSGRYRGYPQRAFVSGRYVKGYSDHFPVYVLLVKPVK